MSERHDAEPTLQTALNASATDLPGPNVVALGRGVYDAAGGGFDYSTPGAPAVRVSGAGQSLTTVRAESSSNFVLRLGIAGSAVTDLSIAIHTPMDAGLVLDGAQSRRVDVSGAGALGTTDGVALSDDALFADGDVAMPSSSNADIDQTAGATGTVSNAHLSGPVGLTTAATGSPALAARDVWISATATGVAVPATGTIAVDEALIAMRGDTATALQTTNGNLTVRGATILAGGGSGTGLSISGSDHADASLTLQDSIVRGFDTNLSRSAAPGATASLTAQYDDVHLPGGTGSGAGTVTVDHNIDADPQFVDPDHGDFHLYARSPAVDAGGPCASPVRDAVGSRGDVAGDRR